MRNSDNIYKRCHCLHKMVNFVVPEYLACCMLDCTIQVRPREHGTIMASIVVSLVTIEHPAVFLHQTTTAQQENLLLQNHKEFPKLEGDIASVSVLVGKCILSLEQRFLQQSRMPLYCTKLKVAVLVLTDSLRVDALS